MEYLAYMWQKANIALHHFYLPIIARNMLSKNVDMYIVATVINNGPFPAKIFSWILKNMQNSRFLSQQCHIQDKFYAGEITQPFIIGVIVA